MDRVRVKICGVKTAEDAQCAARCGADAIGLVFCDGSPRTVTAEQAKEIIADLPPFVSVVGLFMNTPKEQIEKVLSQVSLDIIQFHGKETQEECCSYGLPYIKAVPMRDSEMRGQDKLLEYQKLFFDCKGFVVDSHAPGEAGGSGEIFDWKILPKDFSKPLLLAGGLNPDNVAQAIVEARPYCVDVSSGVESQKGVKDHDKIAAFIRGVNSVS